MAKKYTKQHIVPACYIANFGINGNQGRKSKIYYYIAKKEISGCGVVNDFPLESNYYDIPKLGDNKKVIELLFQKIESGLSELIKELIGSIIIDRNNRTSLTVDYPLNMKQELSAQFAMQLLRTHFLRNHFKYIYDQLKADAPSWYPIPEYDKEDFKRLQNIQILSFRLANFYANMFDDKKWVILVNHTDLPFIISDNPLISINHSKEKHLSAASDKLTYYIPISPTYAIEMYPKSAKCNDLFYFDLFNKRNIAIYNLYIEYGCTRMLFSNKDLNYIKELIKRCFI